MKVLRILVLILGIVSAANAQTTDRAVLTGTVYDASGAIIPKISVEFTNSKGEKFKSLTDELGVYRIYIPASKYEITFGNVGHGFQKYVIKDYIIAGKMQLDIALEAPGFDECGPIPCFDDTQPVELELKPKISDKILQTRPLEQLPEEQNKPKGKKKNNKQ